MRCWVIALSLAACGGGGSIEGEPLIASTLTAMFDNRPWTPAYGFARSENGTFILRVGTDKISCADNFMGLPRDGTYGVTGVAGEPMMGNFNASFSITEIVDGDLVGRGSTGSLMLTTVTETEVSAVFGFSVTIDNGAYAMTGAVTMLRCP